MAMKDKLKERGLDDEYVADKLKDFIDEGMIKVMIIPDIESVNYGRGVGYEIIEHVPPKEIGEISATKIRESWKKSLASD